MGGNPYLKVTSWAIIVGDAHQRVFSVHPTDHRGLPLPCHLCQVLCFPELGVGGTFFQIRMRFVFSAVVRENKELSPVTVQCKYSVFACNIGNVRRSSEEELTESSSFLCIYFKIIYTYKIQDDKINEKIATLACIS